MTSSRTARWLGVMVGAGLAITAGCTATGPTGPSDQFGPSGTLRLVSFESCEEAADQLRAATLAQVTPWGLNHAYQWDISSGADGAEAAAAAPGLAPDAAAPGVPDAAARGSADSDQQHSGTNVHEAGVDEPDLIKTDGRRIVVVHQDILRVIDTERGVQTGTLGLSDPAPDGQLRGWQPADLLLHGDRALVLMGSSWWGGMPMPMPVEPDGTEPDQQRDSADRELIEPVPQPIMGPKLLLVDISGQPRIISEYLVDGDLLDARAVGQVARVVVRSAPRFSFPHLDVDSTDRERLAAHRAVIERADITAWLPRYQVREEGTSSEGQVGCTSMSRPASYSGTSMLTVLTFDLTAAGLGNGTPVSVVADGDAVYSNGSSLYVASDQRWRIVPGREGTARPDERTEIYKFDVSQPGPPRFAAAGAVPGWLINQYAMSEWEDHLRVATTTGDLWGSQPDSESAVYVLAQRDRRLADVGSVGGLGKTERIYSVRFAGPVGYVVTFRETDPLYTLDLSNPAAPEVLGELKITGYSSYLHPLDADRLLGVGQEADLDGVTRGMQVSLFDVSDLSDPSLHATHHIPDGYSEAEHDPHAFLWWPQEQLLVVPLTTMRGEFDGPSQPDTGALLLRVHANGFSELGLVSHPSPAGMEWLGQIRRSLVIGDTLWTFSELGLQANALSTLQRTAWVQF